MGENSLSFLNFIPAEYPGNTIWEIGYQNKNILINIIITILLSSIYFDKQWGIELNPNNDNAT